MYDRGLGCALDEFMSDGFGREPTKVRIRDAEVMLYAIRATHFIGNIESAYGDVCGISLI